MIFQLKFCKARPLTILGWDMLSAEVGRNETNSNKLLFSWRGGDIE
jgi:hypothetical protein